MRSFRLVEVEVTAVTTEAGLQDAAIKAAKDRLKLELAGLTEQPIFHFCGALIDWVFTGLGKPLAEPTAHACQAAKQAVKHGLREAYVGEKRPNNDVLRRLATL